MANPYFLRIRIFTLFLKLRCFVLILPCFVIVSFSIPCLIIMDESKKESGFLLLEFLFGVLFNYEEGLVGMRGVFRLFFHDFSFVCHFDTRTLIGCDISLPDDYIRQFQHTHPQGCDGCWKRTSFFLAGQSRKAADKVF